MVDYCFCQIHLECFGLPPPFFLIFFIGGGIYDTDGDGGGSFAGVSGEVGEVIIHGRSN